MPKYTNDTNIDIIQTLKIQTVTKVVIIHSFLLKIDNLNDTEAKSFTQTFNLFEY